jgi:hypothetical protein
VADAKLAAEQGVVDAVMAVDAEVVGGYRPEDHHQKKSRQMNCQNCSHPSY